jgi:hypothetical protein
VGKPPEAWGGQRGGGGGRSAFSDRGSVRKAPEAQGWGWRGRSDFSDRGASNFFKCVEGKSPKTVK